MNIGGWPIDRFDPRQVTVDYANAHIRISGVQLGARGGYTCEATYRRLQRTSTIAGFTVPQSPTSPAHLVAMLLNSGQAQLVAQLLLVTEADLHHFASNFYSQVQLDGISHYAATLF